MRGLGHLRAGGVDYNTLTTVHAANERRGREVYRFLRDDCGARFLQFIPVIERVTPSDDTSNPAYSSWRDRPLYTQNGTGVTSRSVSPEGYGRFLIDIFEEWVRRDIGEVYVQMFDATVANWVGEQPGMCVHHGGCPKDRFTRTGRRPRPQLLIPSFKLFFGRVEEPMRNMKLLLA